MKEVKLYKADESFVPAILKDGSIDEKTIRAALADSDQAWIATVDGEVACVWGLHIQNPSLAHAYLWVHTTKVAEANWFRFTRRSKEFVDNLARTYRFLNGHIDPNRCDSERWIKWLGFEVGEVNTPLGARVFWRGER